MKKDAYYFPHFCNARSDRKIKRVLKDLGIEGYGIYFMLLEVLREQEGFKYPLSDVDLLADEFGTSEAKISVIISKYELFQIDETNNFFSIKQIYYLQPYIEKSERARLAANKRWDNANASTNAKQIESKSNADAMQVKERKVEQSKEKESEENEIPFFHSPLLSEHGFISAVEAKERYLTRAENIQSMNQLAMVKNTTPEYILKWVDKFTEKLIAQSWRNTMSEWLRFFGNWLTLNYKSEMEVMQLTSGNSKTIANLAASEKAKQNLKNGKSNN